MTNIAIADQELQKLKWFDTVAEVRNSAGDLVGYFVKPERFAEMRIAEDDAREAELDRRSQEPGGMTLEEVWKELGLENDPDIVEVRRRFQDVNDLQSLAELAKELGIESYG